MFITELDVSLNKADESFLLQKEFKQILVNLNKGAGGKEIYLWYKEGTCSPITRIQFSFTEKMAKGLMAKGFTKIQKNLNAGAGGSNIYLWYYKGTGESHVPINDIHVSDQDDAQRFKSGWERLSCDLNREDGGNHIFLWVKREIPTYICDIAATDDPDVNADLLLKDYIRVDESTNRSTSADPVFLWFLPTTKKGSAIMDVDVSNSREDYQRLQQQKYKLVEKNLNKGNKGAEVFLWYKKDGCSGEPIQAITLMYDEQFLKEF